MTIEHWRSEAERWQRHAESVEKTYKEQMDLRIGLAHFWKHSYEWALTRLDEKENPPPDVRPLRTGSAEIKQALKTLLPSLLDAPSASGVFVTFDDAEYYVVTEEEFNLLRDWDGTNLEQYIIDAFDCDKFAGWFRYVVARKCRINSVALVRDWSSLHAYNVVALRKPEGGLYVKLYEPQQDLFVPHGSGLYKLEWGQISF